MLEAALTGGIASGKSTVAAMFAELGAEVVDTDHIARQAVAPGSPALAAIVRRFGAQALDAEGRLRRRWLREKIFSDPQARADLNAIVHPEVWRQVQKRLQEIRAHEPRAVAVVDVPLLYETAVDSAYQAVVVVYVPPQMQAQRLMDRDGVSPEEARASLAAQMPLAQKRDKAQFVVDNSGSLPETRRQVQAVWNRLVEMAARPTSP